MRDVVAYQIALRTLSSILTSAELSKVEPHLADKHFIKKGSIYRQNDWTSTPLYGNIQVEVDAL